MKVLFDTNVVLDVLLARDPHVDDAARLFALVDHKRIDGVVCATTVTTIFYIASKTAGVRVARQQVESLLSLFSVAPVTGLVLSSALKLNFSDFEDAVIHEAAAGAGVNAIVTRNLDDFQRATLPTMAPAELLAVIAALR